MAPYEVVPSDLPKKPSVHGRGFARSRRRTGWTPFYAYSQADIEDRFRAYENAFKPIPHVICFAVKAVRISLLGGLSRDWAVGLILFRVVS